MKPQLLRAAGGRTGLPAVEPTPLGVVGIVP